MICDAKDCEGSVSVLLSNQFLLCASCADQLFQRGGRLIFSSCLGGKHKLPLSGVPDSFWTPDDEDPEHWRALCSKEWSDEK